MSKQATYLEFQERMAGFFVAKRFNLSPSSPLSQNDFEQEAQRFDKLPFEFNLTIQVPDLEKFFADNSTPSSVKGAVTDIRFGDSLSVEHGFFHLFTRPAASPDRDTAKEMHYTLFLTDREERKWTLFGYKNLLKEASSDIWSQTTTLYFYLWEGHSFYENFGDKEVTGVGVLKISPTDFLKQLSTFKTNAPTALKDKQAILKYFKAFLGNLWEAYAPFIFSTTTHRWNEHAFPPQTLQGVHQGESTLHPLDTRDGLSISIQRFKYQATKDVILLVHGLTSSTDMFIMPEHENLVNHLHKSGFGDVWSLDWRGSGRFAYNLTPHGYTIDDIAQYDIPRGVQYIREHCGKDVRIHVIAHCVGSLAFMASYAAGYIDDIASITANSVSLTPQVHWPALMKMMVGPELLENVLGYPYISPRIPYMPGTTFGKWISVMERSLRSECKEPACHMISFMWGWGFPAVFNHRNIHPTTHRRLADLFGGTSFHYHKHIRKMLLQKKSVSWDGKINYLEEMKTRALPPTLLISGEENHIFPQSNKVTYEALQKTPNGPRVQYREYPHYGHQDIFMGQFCDKEVFPELVQFLKQHSSVQQPQQKARLRIA
ncbi:alpha/beta fold hydrolase [Bdellovibrio bacteriovorus]|uniref:alpha/beta fold hydrolase n=1 Tax=Bdellovibrio bacteriovorus TaxID=959 RepID=UPI0035A6F6D9